MNELPGVTWAWSWRRVSNRTFSIIHPDKRMPCQLERLARAWERCGTLFRPWTDAPSR